MIYSSLKIGPNGGIFTDMEKIHQNPNAVTLAIGIGGTGIAALRTFKNTVYNRLIPDNSDKEYEEPRFDRIRFLAIDSDKSSCNGEGYSQIARWEYFAINASNVVGMLSNKTVLKNDPALQWFEPERFMVYSHHVEGDMKMLSRMLLVKKAYELKTKIEAIIKSATGGL